MDVRGYAEQGKRKEGSGYRLVSWLVGTEVKSRAPKSNEFGRKTKVGQKAYRTASDHFLSLLRLTDMPFQLPNKQIDMSYRTLNRCVRRIDIIVQVTHMVEQVFGSTTRVPIAPQATEYPTLFMRSQRSW